MRINMYFLKLTFYKMYLCLTHILLYKGLTYLNLIKKFVLGHIRYRAKTVFNTLSPKQQF